ncbi:TraM recognition domain-containing protein [Quadrisphaera sp. INWT6]|nr:TraM recognition domain-containing protein [Quadrisphaera sp. INWT6]
MLLWTALVVLTVGGALVTGAVHLGARLQARLDGPAATPVDLPANPFELLAELTTGRQPWPPAATAVLVALAVLALLAASAAALLWRRRRRGRAPVDRVARYLGRLSAVRHLTEDGARRRAERLGVQTSDSTEAVPAGLPIGRHVPSGRLLVSSWEDVCVDIWGPRTGKTTSRVVPAILAAPGAVLATSNKRDLVDATRDVRAARGRVWVFDPQGVAEEAATWWWDPLSYVVDEVKAVTLARLFAAAGRDANARTDAYFDNAATSLLANLLLAAAVAGRPITQVYLWLANPREDEPVEILRAHDHPMPAAAVAGVVNAPEKQRGGIYGTAQEIVSFLTNRVATRWVTPDGGSAASDRRPRFDPAAFVAAGGQAQTLYSLSREGEGSAGPLVTALTVAVTEAAERLARRSAGGRLPVPLVGVLDEAANVCRWRDLPDLYSHYGSRGIVLMTFLQSWSQGVEVWGRDGMRKLWGAATVRVFGGGNTDPEFLPDISQLVGEYDAPTPTTSTSRTGSSRSYSTRSERVLDVAELAALPLGRALVFASGTPAVLVRTLPWMEGPHAAAVRASLDAHDPTGRLEPAEVEELRRTSQVAPEPPSARAANPWLT